MANCEYCDRRFDSDGLTDEEYLAHLAESHADELGRIDQQRLKHQWEGDVEDLGGPSYRLSALQIGLIAAGVTATVGVFAVSYLG